MGTVAHHRLSLRVSALAMLLVPSAAFAQRAEVAQPSELPGEGTPYQLDVSLQARYGRLVGAGIVPTFRDAGEFGLRSTWVIGHTLAYVGGLEALVGGGETGAVYGVTAWPAGIGLRWGMSNYLALRGGIGLDGVANAVQLAGRIPAQLLTGLEAGPLRFSIWAGLAWVPWSPSRKNGSSWLPTGDELEAGVSVRIARQRLYWTTTNAGGGPSLGIVYREFMSAREVLVTLGVDLSGGRRTP